MPAFPCCRLQTIPNLTLLDTERAGVKALSGKGAALCCTPLHICMGYQPIAGRVIICKWLNSSSETYLILLIRIVSKL